MTQSAASDAAAPSSTRIVLLHNKSCFGEVVICFEYFMCIITAPAMQYRVDLDLPKVSHTYMQHRSETTRLISANDSVIVSNYNGLPLG